MSIDSVGASNTAGYAFVGGEYIGGIAGVGNGYEPFTPMVGGGRKRRYTKRKGGGKFSKLRRKVSKRIKKLTTDKIRSVKKKIIHKSNKRYKKKRMVQRKDREEIIKSVEQGKPISKKNTKHLSPSMKKFIEGIDATSGKSMSVVADLKTKGKKKRRTKKKRRDR